MDVCKMYKVALNPNLSAENAAKYRIWERN